MRSTLAAIADLVSSLMLAAAVAVLVLAFAAPNDCKAPDVSPLLPSPRNVLPVQPRDGPAEVVNLTAEVEV